METIISACISAAVTLIVCVISNNAQQEKTRTLMEYKLEELTKRVNEHNNLIKRTYALEEKMSVHEEQIKVANHKYPGDVRTVDVHVRRLREKIESSPSEPKYVHTKWGVGYYFKN